MSKSVIVSPYNPEWPKQFIELRNTIWPKVKVFAESIEHVGSTSVEGLAAKAVIDIDIIIPDMSFLDRAVNALSEIGYVHRGNLGVFEREAFRKENSTVKHNLYVCPRESFALRNHLCLRDSLRRDKNLRDGYASLKLDLARKFANSIDEYCEGKTEFIVEILKANGFGPDRLEEIRAANAGARDTRSVASDQAR